MVGEMGSVVSGTTTPPFRLARTTLDSLSSNWIRLRRPFTVETAAFNSARSFWKSWSETVMAPSCGDPTRARG